MKGRILIGKERATERAGRCSSGHGELVLDAEVELLAHGRGWIWAIYYSQGRERTHFVLIHSDGTPLARAVAAEIIAADRTCSGSLHQLSCLNPAPPRPTTDVQQVIEALGAYWRYLGEECGYIQLDGLPAADPEAVSRRLKLEGLFVPMHLDIDTQTKRQQVGTVLSRHPRLAILGPPGSGKSTLLKRLAVAYADPSGQWQIADDLPQCDWFPLLFRCRELRELARGSFSDLIEALSAKEPVRQHAAVFRAYVDRALLGGRVLLLVDGLDEISDPSDRAAFVSTIRTAIQACPGTALVVTSREAGFHHVAAHLTANFTRATLSPFDAKDIERLIVAWHHEVVGDTEKVRADAEQLTATIVASDRILGFAANPLLLMTMLLIRRWVGSLSTRRAVLYGKAVEVLLMTWNTAYHAPILDDEAFPQLCYVASAMMLAGVQKVSRPRLAELLQEARDALPTELAYVQDSVENFIYHVEDRSGLLIMTGLDVEDGRLVEFFEFCHLTFQEFLTARAMVEGWHPGRKDGDSLVTVLEPHFEDEKWRETIPLAAALGGKATDKLIQRLAERVGAVNELAALRVDRNPLLLTLGYCLADEVPARPETIRIAVHEMVRLGSVFPRFPFAAALARGRYGATLREEAGNALLERTQNFYAPAEALQQAVWWQTVGVEDTGAHQHAASRFLELLTSLKLVERCEGALGFTELCRRREDIYWDEVMGRIGAALVEMLFSESSAEIFSATRALYELGISKAWHPPSKPDMLGRLFTLWCHSENPDLRRVITSTISVQRLMPRDAEDRFCSTIRPDEFESLAENFIVMDNDEQTVAFVIAWYLGTPWSDKELAENVRALIDAESDDLDKNAKRTLLYLLDQLGDRY